MSNAKTSNANRQPRCPVLELAIECEKLYRTYTKVDTDLVLLEPVQDRIEAIKEQASYTMPRSPGGAAFQIMVANGDASLSAEMSRPRAGDLLRRASRLMEMSTAYLIAQDTTASTRPECISYLGNPTQADLLGRAIDTMYGRATDAHPRC